MTERTNAVKPKRVGQKIAAAAAAFALGTTAGCSQPSAEQLALRDTTRQVFADLIAGKPVNRSAFGANTFTISLKDKYPNSDPADVKGTRQGAIYTYETGEDRIKNALDFYDDGDSGLELRALAVCDTAGVNNLLTAEELRKVRDTWDYYGQLGGQKELRKGGTYNDAFEAVIDLRGICMVAIHRSLVNGADVTFVPAMND